MWGGSSLKELQTAQGWTQQMESNLEPLMKVDRMELETAEWWVPETVPSLDSLSAMSLAQRTGLCWE